MKCAAVLLFLGPSLLSCAGPSQHDPNATPIEVYVDPTWPSDHQREIDRELGLLSALGPRFRRIGDIDYAYVIVRHWESPSCARTGAARYVPGSREVWIDPVCTPGFTAFRAAVGHEIGHRLGMRHICRRNERLDCSPVGYGPAMMNPGLMYGSTDGPNTNEVWVGDGDIPSDAPTDLDLVEYRITTPR